MQIPSGWEFVDNKLVREFTFSTFEDAIGFITRVAAIASKRDHHPAIYNVYNKVTLTLSTHDQGDIATDKDRELAEEINKL